jgi:hypothetical protein
MRFLRRKSMNRTVFNAASKLVGGLCVLATCAPAFAAKAPDAVERTITFTGSAALSFGELFGLSPAAGSTVSLRLGRATAWMVYLLKQDTKERLWNDNEGSPARYEVIELSSGPIPSITISPYWLDEATRLPSPEVGSYSFESPFLREDLPDSEPWTRLIKRLQAGPGWDRAGDTPFKRCFASPERVELCVTVMRRDDYPDNKKVSGYIVLIEAHLPGTKI